MNRGLDGTSQVFLGVVQGVITGILVFSRPARTIAVAILVAEMAGLAFSWSAGFIVDPFMLVSVPFNVITPVLIRLIKNVFQDDGTMTSMRLKKMNKWLRLALQGGASGCMAVGLSLILMFLVGTSIVPFATYLTIVLAIIVLHVIFFGVYKVPVDVYTAALAHHIEDDADHSIMVTFGNLTTYLCTRCTGMILGISVVFYFFQTVGIVIPSLVALIMDIFVPMPIFIDWGTQRLGYRKSTTNSRLFTGALTGFGFFLLTFSIIEYPVISGLVLCAYFVIFFLIYFLSFRRGY